MKTAAIVIEEREKLIVAAHLEMKDVVPSLSQLIGYRQRVAQEILKHEGCSVDERTKYLWDSYNYVNSSINQLLGL